MNSRAKSVDLPFNPPVAARTVALGLGAMAIVVAFGALVARTPGMTRIDQGVSSQFNAGAVGAVGSFSRGVYSVFSPAPAIALTLVIAAIIWLVSRNWRLGTSFGLTVAITWLPSAIVKTLIDRPRPNVMLLVHPFAAQPTDPSYPSGHMVLVTALVMTAILFSRGRRLFPVVALAGPVLILLVAGALVIDGVHYPSDVAASIVWSIGVAPLALLVVARVLMPLSHRFATRRAT